MKKFLNHLHPDLVFNRYSLINSLKTTFACLLGLLVANLLGLVQPQWVLITILIVMASQYRLGGAMLKGYSRLFATAIGSSLAAAILFLFSAHTIVVYSVLFLIITIFIYLASNSKDYSYSYTLGAVTLVVIVVSSNPQLKNALDRVVEIILGVIIAILVSRLVLPIHAEKILYKNISKALELLNQVYKLFIREDKTFHLQTNGSNLEEEIVQNFAAQTLLLKEACIESSNVRANRSKYIIILRLERRLLRSIYMLHYTLRVSLRSFGGIITMQEFKMLHLEITVMIDDLAKKMLNPNYAITDYDLSATYDDIVIKLRSTFDQYSFEEKNKVHAFIFCLGHVIKVLKRMKRMIIEIK